jgi:hypothetical protein
VLLDQDDHDRGVRSILTRLAAVACPPTTPETLDRVVADVRRHIACLPRAARLAIPVGLWLFNWGRPRRFTRLDGERADACLARVLAERTGPVAVVVRLVKGLTVLYYYEQPEVAAAMGYRPDAYIAEVTARRTASYG